MKTPEQHIREAEFALDEVRRLELDAGTKDSIRRWHHMELANAHLRAAEVIMTVERHRGDS